MAAVSSNLQRGDRDHSSIPQNNSLSCSREQSTANDNFNDLTRKLSSHRRSHHRRGSSSWSVRSWDSHAHYQDFHNELEDDDDDENNDENDENNAENNDGRGRHGGLFPSRASSIICYCDMSTFKTPRTILRVLLVVRSILILMISTNTLLLIYLLPQDKNVGTSNK